MAPMSAADGDERCWEMRTYVTPAGKLPALLSRFRDHTCTLFEKHGMTLIGFWTPTDGEAANNTLIYVLSHKTRAAATESWKNFRADPVWVEAKKASEVDGSLTTSVVSVFMKPTDFSKLK
ncbi:MAG: NIPSNAP family protein [Planctomycetes bacterium]|nr:NIPSNAP family protein [Planctomycetota bacterium]